MISLTAGQPGQRPLRDLLLQTAASGVQSVIQGLACWLRHHTAFQCFKRCAESKGSQSLNAWSRTCNLDADVHQEPAAKGILFAAVELRYSPSWP